MKLLFKKMSQIYHQAQAMTTMKKTSNTFSRNLKSHTVVSSFTQTLDDELYIQPGDKVQINNEYDDGWCLGKNLTRGGARGVLPRHCLDI